MRDFYSSLFLDHIWLSDFYAIFGYLILAGIVLSCIMLSVSDYVWRSDLGRFPIRR